MHRLFTPTKTVLGSKNLCYNGYVTIVYGSFLTMPLFSTALESICESKTLERVTSLLTPLRSCWRWRCTISNWISKLEGRCQDTTIKQMINDDDDGDGNIEDLDILCSAADIDFPCSMQPPDDKLSLQPNDDHRGQQFFNNPLLCKISIYEKLFSRQFELLSDIEKSGKTGE